MRNHAWGILAALTGNGANTQPEWEKWQGKCNVGLGQNCPSGSDALQAPVNHLYEKGNPLLHAQAPSVDDGHSFNISAALYNPVAAKAIRDNSLSKRSAWNVLSKNLNAASAKATNDSASAALTNDFGTGSIIVKEMWEVVEKCNPNGTLNGSCPTRIPVWDPKQHPQDFKGASLQAPAEWARSFIAIDPNMSAPCDTTRPYTYHPTDSPVPAKDLVSIQCFHFLKVAPSSGIHFHIGSGEIVNESSGWTPQGETYLVLVGFHVITSELPTWTWNTFWWTLPNVDTGKRNDHPADIRNHLPWALYSMDTTLSSSTPLESDRGPKIVFNPYLEGRLLYGPISNCLACHFNAAYRPQSATSYVGLDMAKALQPRCFYFTPAAPGCSVHNAGNEASGIQTHFLWSLALKQDKKNPNAVQNLQAASLSVSATDPPRP